MRQTTIVATKIVELHEVRDADKYDSLVSAMASDGWIGRSILAMDMGDYIQAITGSHRIAAAREAAISVPVLIIEDADINETFAAEWGFAADDDDRLRVLNDFGLTDAASLMAAENK